MPVTGDDLSDVIPNEKFWAEFPDGIVPIRHVPASMVREAGALASLEKAHDDLAQVAQVRASVRDLEAARVSYLADKCTSKGKVKLDAHANLVFMLRSGLTLRQVAEYVEETLPVLVAFVTHKPSMQGVPSALAEHMADMDEELRTSHLTHLELANKHKLSTQAVRAQHTRILTPEQAEQLYQARAWVCLLKYEGWSNSDVVTWVHAQFPATIRFVDGGYAGNRGRDSALAQIREVFGL